MQKMSLLCAVANGRTNLLCGKDMNDVYAEENVDITTLNDADFDNLDLQHTQS